MATLSPVKKLFWSLAIVLPLALVFFTAVQAHIDHGHTPVTLCHATPPDTAKEGYNLITTDDDGVFTQGHDSEHDADIIPAFDYWSYEKVGSHQECPDSNSAYGNWHSGKTCEKWIGGHKKYAYPITVDDKDWVKHTYPGKNLSNGGQAILNNGCVVPRPEPTPTSTPTPSPTPTPTPTPVDCVWSGWGECSCECGGGTQTRTHSVEAQYGGQSCVGSSEQSCNTQTCEQPELTPTPTPTEEPGCDGDCNEPTPTPEPTETGTPEPTPTGEVGPNPTPTSTPETPSTGDKQSDLEVNGPTCTENRFSVKITIRDNDKPVENVAVRFRYKDQEDNQKTNNEGTATTNFTFSGNGDLKVEADGYPTQDRGIKAPENCGVGGAVLGASTTGQVLGITSYAAAGVAEEMVMNLMMIGGMLVTAIGATGYKRMNA
jgi:hypothetical protein